MVHLYTIQSDYECLLVPLLLPQLLQPSSLLLVYLLHQLIYHLVISERVLEVPTNDIIEPSLRNLLHNNHLRLSRKYSFDVLHPVLLQILNRWALTKNVIMPEFIYYLYLISRFLDSLLYEGLYISARGYLDW